MRRRPFLLLVGALLVSGCGTSAPDRTAPSLSPSPAPYSATPAPSVPGPWGAAASALHEDSVYPTVGEPSIDALHYGLDLRWDKARKRLSGSATIRFRAPADQSRIRLDLAPQLHPSAVLLDGKPARFSHPGKDLVVTTPVVRDRRYTLLVRYAGVPAPWPAPSKRSDTPNVGWVTLPSGQVRTMQEPYGAFTWYPVDDQPGDKAFYDVRIDVPGRWVGVSNGRLVSKVTSHGRTRTHWRLTHPAASYLTTIAIGPYREYRDTGPRGLPIGYWVRDQDRSILPLVRQAPAAIGWLEKRLGPLPSDRMSFVVVPQASGMETQDMITLGIESLRDDDGQVIVHELAHQWYGDAVTPLDWRDVWMNEGMATYLQAEWTVATHKATWSTWLTEFRRADTPLRRKYGPPGAFHRDDFAEANVYYPPALMWRVLRGKLGAPTFDRLRRDWIQQHLYTNADRTELIAWWSKHAGQDLGSFFATWLMSPTTPAGGGAAD